MIPGLPLDLPDLARDHPQALGAAAVQPGTPFVATEECDAHSRFKQVLAEAGDEDIVQFMSVAGLPARAVKTPWLALYLDALPRLSAKAHEKPRCTLSFDCLAQCGLRDGTPGWGQFCIDTQLAAGLCGEVDWGLFFRGAGALPFGARIVAVRQLIERLRTPGVPLGTPPVATAIRVGGRPRPFASAQRQPRLAFRRLRSIRWSAPVRLPPGLWE